MAQDVPWKWILLMSHAPHEPATEFPGRSDVIHARKLGDHRVARLVEEDHGTTRAIHRVETRVGAAPDERETGLPHERVRLKGEIARLPDQKDA
jgi:uncharacterized protein YdcH (DUF465 family)